MHGKAPATIIAVSLIAMLSDSASTPPLAGGDGLTVLAETLLPVESVHYYGYGRGYYGAYGRDYYGHRYY
jgi:hypothetical protein